MFGVLQNLVHSTYVRQNGYILQPQKSSGDVRGSAPTTPMTSVRSPTEDANNGRFLKRLTMFFVAALRSFKPTAESGYTVQPLDSSSDVDLAQPHLQTKNSHIRDAYQVEVMN